MAESEHYYLVEGEALPLWRVDTVCFVTPARGHSIRDVGERLARSTRIAVDPEFPKDVLVVRGASKKLREIRSYPDVLCTRAAFVDREGHELILTDEVLVRFADGFLEDKCRALCERLECDIIGREGSLWRLRVQDTGEESPLTIANRLSEEKLVTFAEPNALQQSRLAAIPSDPRFPNQWHLRNTGQGGGVAGADVNALGAWKITRGGRGIRVAVHDTGVDIGHPDLAENIEGGWDFDNDDANPSPGLPHGTACAGVIAAREGGTGVVGIAPRCRLVPLRLTAAQWSVWAATFRWAARNAEIISCSWTTSPSNTLSEAIREVAQGGRNGRGIPIFFATGNDGFYPASYPARLAETIAVGASTNKDRRASYSQVGFTLDFVAPSSGGTLKIETTDVRGFGGYNSFPSPLGDYCNAGDSTGFGGTSSATPLAAGVAALMLSLNSVLSADLVRDILRRTADKIDRSNAAYDENGWSLQYGFGRVNAGNAVGQVNWLMSFLSE